MDNCTYKKKFILYTRWAEKKTNNQLLTKFNKQMEKTWSSSLLYILIIKLKDSSGILNRQFSWSVKIIKFASKKNPKKNCTPGSVGSVLRTFPEDCKYIIDEYNSIKELQARKSPSHPILTGRQKIYSNHS